jgi:hypothetical protein
MLGKLLSLLSNSGASHDSQLLNDVLGDQAAYDPEQAEEAAQAWVKSAKLNGGFNDAEWEALSESEKVRAINRVTRDLDYEND